MSTETIIQGSTPGTPPAPAPGTRRWAERLVPSVADLLFAFWAAAIAIGFSHRLLNSDGDLAWHLRLGEWMLQHGRILRVHDFSHTAPGRSFVPMEWLSEVLFAAIDRAAGLPGIVILAASTLALAAFVAMRFMQRRGVDVVLAYLAATGVALFTSPHWLARPHIFSFLCTVVLLLLLDPPSGRVRPLRFAPLFVLWANLHGGFVFGLGLVGLFLVADALDWLGERTPDRARSVRRRAAALAVSIAATTLNPIGVRLLTRIAGHLGDAYVMNATQEFLSPDFHQLTGKVFLAALLLLTGILIYRGQRPRTAVLLAFLAMTALALQSRRNISLFGLVAFPLLAVELDADWRRLTSRWLGRARGNIERQDAAAWKGGWAALVALLLVLLAAAGGRVGGVPLLPSGFDPAVFPVRMVEAARAARLQGRLFNDFTWGGYLLWAWPEQKVFIDGGTALYGSDIMRAYAAIEERRPGWREALDRDGIDLVLMPRRAALSAELRREPGWRIWKEDSLAVMFVRSAGRADSGGSSSTASMAPGRIAGP